MLWAKQTAIPILMEISKALGYQWLVFLKYWCSSLKDECCGQICTFRESLKGWPYAQRIWSLGTADSGAERGEVADYARRSVSVAPDDSVSEGKWVLSEWTTWAARLLLTPLGALLLSRLGGAH